MPAAAARGSGSYTGPLFDTHLHQNTPGLNTLSASALCTYLARNDTLWAVVFFTQGPGGIGPAGVNAQQVAIARAVGGRIVPLYSPGMFEGQTWQDGWVRGGLRPAGPFQGMGEFGLYRPQSQSITLASPQMAVFLKAANDVGAIVMIHPGGASLGRAMELAEMETAVRTYPNVTWLFHGRNSVGSTGIAPTIFTLMSRYPNVYFSADVANWGFSGQWPVQVSSPGLMYPGGEQFTGTSADFVATANRIGVDAVVQQGIRDLTPLVRQFPDRVLWGTDRAINFHFEEQSTDLILSVARRIIGGLPAELQEGYAFRNALRVFGKYFA